MEKKSIQKKDSLAWKKRTAMVAMAVILGATGLKYCGKKEETNGNAITNTKIKDKEIEEVIKEDETEKIIEEIIETEEPKKEVNFFDTIDLSNYTGYSIVDALELNGYRSDFEFRTELANYFGFDPYKGTEEQNLALLKLLGARVPEENLGIDNNINNNSNRNDYQNNNNNNSSNINNNNQTNSGEYCPECNEDHDHNKDHKHIFTKWTYLNTKKEQRVCLICGKIEKRNHNIIQDTKFVPSTNGKHKKITLTQCSTCDFKKKKTEEENCTIKEWNFDAELNKEVGICSECGRVQTRDPEKHRHQYRLIDTKYVVNDDKKHTKIETFECIAKDDIRTYTYTLSHSYSDWKLNSETGLYERCCHFCKHKQTRIHTNDHDYERVIEYFPIEGNEELHRIVVKDVCKHGDDEKIVLDTLEKHSFASTWTYNSKTGMDERLCGKCGFIHERAHEHDFEEKVERVEISDNHEKHMKRIIHKCSICNKEELISKTEEAHTYGDFVPNSSHTQETGTCSLCNHVYTRDIEHQHDFEEKVERIEIPGNHEKHIKRVIHKCSICNEEKLVSETEEEHTYGSFVPNSSHTQETGTCSLCNHVYTRDIAQHEHDYKYLDSTTYASLYAEKGVNPELTELLRCETDGAFITINHELGNPVINGCAATKTCSHDYCNHQAIEYSHIESDEFVNWVSSEDVCKLVNVTCSSCGTTLETNVKRGHSYIDSSDAYGIENFETCVCGRYRCGDLTGLLSDLSTYNLRNEDDYLIADISIEDDKVLKRSLK